MQKSHPGKLSPDIVEQAAAILKAIGHPIRLQILECLEEGEKSVGQIQTLIGRQQAVTSHHLNVLRLRGILRARRQGTMVYYAVTGKFMLQILDCIRTCARDQNALGDV